MIPVPSLDLFNAIASPEDYAKDWVNWILSTYSAEGIWILEDTLNRLQVIDATNKKKLGVILDLSDYIEAIKTKKVISTPWGEALNYSLLKEIYQ